MTDLWDAVVGIPLDMWRAADSPDDLADLLRRRAAGELYPEPETFREHLDRNPDHFAQAAIHSMSEGEVATVCQCGAVFPAVKPATMFGTSPCTRRGTIGAACLGHADCRERAHKRRERVPTRQKTRRAADTPTV